MSDRIVPTSFPIGTPFDRLTTVGLPYRKYPELGAKWYVVCRCSCGIIKEYILLLLRQRTTKSCGCLKSDSTTARNIANRKWTSTIDIHLRDTLSGMKRRCYDPKMDSFGRYGARGIKVCESWMESFASFRDWAINHPAYQVGLTIERLDNDGDYTPENCTWIPMVEQALNRSTTKFFEYQGDRKLLKDWAEDPRCIAPSVNSLYQRLANGWSFEEALLTAAWRNGNRAVKLTEDQVREIRIAHATGNLTHQSIADRFGVSQNNVSNIVNRKTWTQVE